MQGAPDVLYVPAAQAKDSGHKRSGPDRRGPSVRTDQETTLLSLSIRQKINTHRHMQGKLPSRSSRSLRCTGTLSRRDH